ncbi:hypothetical protein AB0C93_27175 [Streptomyces sp. NPDC048518]|uniref:hypothetical protein n=1 Tax=Streptomyces sp. NPDC048518 TaxID=3155029 RepID=UPI0033DF4FAC
MTFPSPGPDPDLLAYAGLLAPLPSWSSPTTCGRTMLNAFRTFLAARLDDLLADVPEGSTGQFAAARLRAPTASDGVHLCDLLAEWERIVAAGRMGENGPVQRLRQDIGLWWRRLTETAAHFDDHADYNPRWRPLTYMCVGHAEFLELTDDA